MDNVILAWQNFVLVTLRTGFLLFFCPPWDSRLIPLPVRVFSVLGLALALTPLVAPFLPPFPVSGGALLALVVREFLLGLALGLVFRLVFAGVQMAGNLAATQMGFGMATLIDPQSQAQSTVLAELLLLVTTLLFLTMDGHHALLRLLVRGFQEVPLSPSLNFPEGLVALITGLGRLMFQLGVQVLAPVLALLFLTQLAIGMVARAVPQIQVMTVGFPLTIALGLFFLAATLVALGPVLVDHLAALKTPLEQVMGLFRN